MFVLRDVMVVGIHLMSERTSQFTGILLLQDLSSMWFSRCGFGTTDMTVHECVNTNSKEKQNKLRSL